MKRFLVIAVGVGFAWLLYSPCDSQRTAAANADPEPMIVHNVYFSLKDNSLANRKGFLEACQKYLSDHPGTVYYSAGVLAEEFAREVNDRDFHMALHLVFKDKAAHDQYQVSEKHKQFIAENSPKISKVRVFDSKVTNSKLAK